MSNQNSNIEMNDYNSAYGQTPSFSGDNSRRQLYPGQLQLEFENSPLSDPASPTSYTNLLGTPQSTQITHGNDQYVRKNDNNLTGVILPDDQDPSEYNFNISPRNQPQDKQLDGDAPQYEDLLWGSDKATDGHHETMSFAPHYDDDGGGGEDEKDGKDGDKLKKEAQKLHDNQSRGEKPSSAHRRNSIPNISNPFDTNKTQDRALQQHLYQYNYIDKPVFISPLLHFRVRQIWITNDTNHTGFIDTLSLFNAIPKICSHFEQKNQILVRTKLQDLITVGAVKITIPQFYNLLATHLGHVVNLPPRSEGEIQSGFKTYRITTTTTHIVAKSTNELSNIADVEKDDNRHGKKTIDEVNFAKKDAINANEIDKIDGELQRVKEKRRKSHFADSIVREQDINTIAQYEDSRFRSRNKQTWCQCITAYIVCPIAIHRFPFIPAVSAKFGSSFVKLFQFISSLIWLNFVLGAFSLLLLIKGQDGFPWISYTPYEITRYLTGGTPETYTFFPKALGFFFGQGLEQSFLFYSDWYSPPNKKWIGALELSLLWTILPMILLFLSIIFVLSHLSTSTINNMDEGERLALTVFSFDHRPKTHQSYHLQGLHLKSTLYSLTSLLREKQFLQQNKQFFNKELNLRVRRFVGIFLNIIAMAACSAGLIFLTIHEKSISRKIADQVRSTLIGQWAVPLLISVLKLIIPYIVKFCVWLETRDVIGTFKHNSWRIFLSKVFFIFVVLFQTQNTHIDIADFDQTVTCRQTMSAILLYKMLASDIVMDVGIELGIGLVFMLWNVIYYKGCKRPRIPQLGSHPTYKELDEHLYKTAIVATPYDIYRGEFLAVECLIDMLYTQILIWVGLPFSPVMSILGVVYFTAQFFTRMLQLLKLSRMPKFSIPQAIQTNVLNIFLSISLACALLSFTVFFSTNVTCGPHLYNPSSAFGNSPVSGIIVYMNSFPHAIAVILNLLGSPIILLCTCGVLFFIIVSYRMIHSQYTTDIKKLQVWLTAERTQIKLMRKQFNLRGKTVTSTNPNTAQFISTIVLKDSSTEHGFGGGQMTTEMILENRSIETKHQYNSPKLLDKLHHEEALLRQIHPDESDMAMLEKRAKLLFVDFIQDLPESISASFQFYCVAVLWMDDITPLLMMDRDEILLVLTQWNPLLTFDSPLTIFFFDLLVQYRGKILL
jgi:hypothetical protein